MKILVEPLFSVHSIRGATLYYIMCTDVYYIYIYSILYRYRYTRHIVGYPRGRTLKIDY